VVTLTEFDMESIVLSKQEIYWWTVGYGNVSNWKFIVCVRFMAHCSGKGRMKQTNQSEMRK